MHTCHYYVSIFIYKSSRDNTYYEDNVFKYTKYHCAVPNADCQLYTNIVSVSFVVFMPQHMAKKHGMKKTATALQQLLELVKLE